MAAGKRRSVASGKTDNGKKRSKGYLVWAALAFGVLLALQCGKFFIEKSWNPIVDATSASTISDLDWANWIDLATIIVTSLIGGAAVAASSIAIKYLNININSGNRSKIDNSSKHTTIEGPRHFHEGDTHVSADVGQFEAVKSEIERLLEKILQAASTRKPFALDRSDLTQLRKLADDSLKRKVRRLEALRGGLKKRANDLQSQVAAERKDRAVVEARLRATEEDLAVFDELLGRAQHGLDEFAQAVERVEQIRRDVAMRKGGAVAAAGS